MENTSSPAAKPTTSVKLVLLGEAAVGKSSLVMRFVSDDFQENKGEYLLNFFGLYSQD